MERARANLASPASAPPVRPPVPGPGRDVALLAGGCAAMNATMAVASAVAGIVTTDAVGIAWAGLPASCAITGTGIGSIAVSRAMASRSRKSGLVAGYTLGLLGATLTALAALLNGGLGVVTLCGGMLMLGLGNASAQLSRYAAAELYPPQQRGFALGGIVWSAALGAVGDHSCSA